MIQRLVCKIRGCQFDDSSLKSSIDDIHRVFIFRKTCRKCGKVYEFSVPLGFMLDVDYLLSRIVDNISRLL